MKKILVLLLLLLPLSTKAQVLVYSAEALSYYYNNHWTEWQELSGVIVSFNTQTGVIDINSAVTQRYVLIGDPTLLDERSWASRAYDKDKNLCFIKFRIRENNTIQLYIIKDDLWFVYSLKAR